MSNNGEHNYLVFLFNLIDNDDDYDDYDVDDDDDNDDHQFKYIFLIIVLLMRRIHTLHCSQLVSATVYVNGDNGSKKQYPYAFQAPVPANYYK